MPTNIIRRPTADAAHLPNTLHPRLKGIYASRGINNADELELAARRLHHFNQLKGVESAAELLTVAIAQGKFIMVVGDFDADGATSVTLCMRALTMLGSQRHDFLVPNRFDFGYGLSPAIVDVAAQQGAQVIVTVDNGISCTDGVDRAKSLGIEVVITDHHLAGETLPSADAIVNPNQPGCDFPSKNLAGVGVAFYLMLAIRQQMRDSDWFTLRAIPEPNLAELLDVVALGTVADVVRLDGNNRILVQQGLQRIRSGKCRPGIKALFDAAGRNYQQLVASDLGFVIGPRLNAAGRLDDMTLGIQCLLTDDDAKARQLAVHLDNLNRERREIEASMQQEAVNVLDSLSLTTGDVPMGLVLFEPDWHQGVIGIVAGRIKDRYHRPTIAMAHQDDEILKGSARSIPGLHIRDLLEEVNNRHPGMLEKFGGHAMAAGLSLKVKHFEAFKLAFDSVAAEWLEGKPLQGQILSDGELGGNDFTLEFAQQLKFAGPWGQGFEEPVFDGEFELVDQRLVGQKHLKMVLKGEGGTLIDGIAFNVDLDAWPNQGVTHARLAYTLDVNEYRGKQSVQLKVDAIESL